VAAAAKKAGATVLLKGVPTVIASSLNGAVFVAAAGNPALATGGSGDVLSGMIGSFLARGLEPLVAAALGAHALGRAAELVTAGLSVRAARPSDVMAAIPVLWKRWGDGEGTPDPPVLVELPMPQLA
jgi:NAD(P)H-hydrate epimerase